MGKRILPNLEKSDVIGISKPGSVRTPSIRCEKHSADFNIHSYLGAPSRAFEQVFGDYFRYGQKQRDAFHIVTASSSEN